MLLALQLWSSPVYAEFSDSDLHVQVREFENYAAPILRSRGIRLQVTLDRKWDMNLGECVLERDVFSINMGARVNETRGLLPDHVSVILCHELGHLMGGAPKKKNVLNDSGDWASVEGESDYFAGYCLGRMWGDPQRVMKAGEGFYGVLHGFYSKYTAAPPPSLASKDNSIADALLITHPGHQCRLDSLVAGLLGMPRPLCWYRPQDKLIYQVSGLLH